MVIENFSEIFGTSVLLIIILLATILAWKIQKLKEAQSSVSALKKSLDEMDEQAKLIVRTDMELNKTQEELDKKITALFALQRLSRTISTSLLREQIFRKIDAACLQDLGFEKTLLFLWNEADKNFTCALYIGYTENEANIITSLVNSDQNTFLSAIRKEKTISSISLDASIKESMKRVFSVRSFVVSPLLPKEGEKGIFFFGTENTDMVITEGDEELITILTNQLAQALENALLFEQTWAAQQGLEKRVEQRTSELTKALEEVRTISKRKSDFVSSVTHELRTPLTSIKGYASILLTGKLGVLPKEAAGRIEKINRHSDELTRLVNDLLDISRIESGKISMNPETQDLKITLEKIADMLSEQLKEKEISLSVDISADARNVSADKGQLERVFINLIGNAVKFTPPKGKINIKTRKIKEGVQIDVSDTGCGIPREAQEAIFEEFYRVDNPINQQLKGSGLGLTLVKRIVEAHKGRIWVASVPDKGSTFSFSLPTQAENLPSSAG